VSGPRTIYLARRHPFLDHGQFVSRWRAHGVLSQQLAGWAGVCRYEQDEAIALPDAIAGLVPGATRDYDGVGMSWFRDDEAIGGFGTREQQQLLRRDELQTFDDVVLRTCFIGRDATVTGARRCAVKLVALLHRPDLVGAALAERLRRFTDALLDTPGFSEHVVKCVISRPIGLDYPGGDRPGLNDYTAVAEIGFAGIEQLAMALTAESFAETVRPAWEGATDHRGITVAVDELRLYDEDALSRVRV
jgi:hypothetical protein